MMFGNITDQASYLWLEEIDSKAALAWVDKQNIRSLTVLEAEKSYQAIFNRLLQINNSKERIAYPAQLGSYLYNFWDDDHHVRGIWRRTTLAEYRKDEPAWETVFDL